MKKIALRFLAGLLAAAALLVVVSVSVYGGEGDSESSVTRDKDVSYAAGHWSYVNEEDIITVIRPETELLLEEGKAVSLPVHIDSEDEFSVLLEYKSVYGKVTESTFTILIGETEYVAEAPLLWKDDSGGAPRDRYGNEVNPRPVCDEGFISTLLTDYRTLSQSPVVFSLDPGDYGMTLCSDTQDMLLKSVTLVRNGGLPTAEEYLSRVPAGNKAGDYIIVEGENYSLKSHSSIRGANIQSDALFPYSVKTRFLNVLDGNSSKTAGQKTVWQFEAPGDGFYGFVFDYMQDAKIGTPCYRRVELDGHVPFREFADYPFPYTGGKFVRMASEYQVYLTKGVHSIALTATGLPVDGCFSDIQGMMQSLSDISMDMKKLTGSTPDRNRTWDIESYRPTIVGDLKKHADKCDEMYASLMALGDVPAYAGNLPYAADALRELARDPDTLPNKIDRLSEGSGSVLQLLGDILNPLAAQPVTLNRIYIGDGQLPRTGANPLRAVSDAARSFAGSFMPGADGEGYSVDGAKDDDTLDVWVNRPIQYVEVMEQLVSTGYANESGKKVRLSIMPNEQKLILSNAAGTNPDLALGVAYWTPYDFAIRGAAENLLNFDDFITSYGDDYNLESLTPLCCGDGVYGAVETLDFMVMFYRKDIFGKLNLKVPDTWSDLKGIMPQLLRYSMNFSAPLSSSSAYKSFHMTSPYYYQNGAAFYSVDGTSAEIRSDNAMKAFYEMTDIFNTYSVAKNVPSFYNSFRYGSIPVGMGGFGMYMQLKVAAPELAGQWDIALSPGTLQDDGTVARYQVANGTAGMIFNNSDKKTEAWDFLKWWLSKDVQVRYAYDVQSRYGSEYLWNTANLHAFEELPYPSEHKKTILEQWKWQKETPRHPAGYMVEREISNAWINVVLNSMETVPSLDGAALNSDREILKKLEEFGYIDSKGNTVREFRNLTAVELKEMYDKANR